MAGRGDAPGAEGHGSTVEEATAAALTHLGLTAEEVEVEVLSPGVRALPGERVSSGAAHVRVQPVAEEAGRGRAILGELLRRMEIPAAVRVRRLRGAGEDPAHVILDVTGDDLGLLIGWRGETLRALQNVVSLMVGVDDRQGSRLIVDVERYRARREDQVRDLAQRLADRVKQSGERYSLEPMRAFERRVVHVTLQADEGVRTESVGREPSRKIVIHPAGGGDGPLEPERAGREGPAGGSGEIGDGQEAGEAPPPGDREARGR